MSTAALGEPPLLRLLVREGPAETMPIQPRTTRPCAMMSASTPRTMFTGMAKADALDADVLGDDGGVDADQRAAGVGPARRPSCRSLIGASVWMKSSERGDPELLAAGRAHDPVSDRLTTGRWITDREHEVADPQLIGAP